MRATLAQILQHFYKHCDEQMPKLDLTQSGPRLRSEIYVEASAPLCMYWRHRDIDDYRVNVRLMDFMNHGSGWKIEFMIWVNPNEPPNTYYYVYIPPLESEEDAYDRAMSVI